MANRDYGAIWGADAPQVAINETKRTQVYTATHDGNLYLPYMHRSFISFSYGGKNIESFNVLATIENNSLNRNAYATFSDNVATSDVYDGQVYWNTHYHTYEISFNLATDHMSEEDLENFKEWFKPGQIKELILAEHPNRAILARVASVPMLNLIPFEYSIETKIANLPYKTSITTYKGNITLSFVADEPFWYSKVNILDHQNDDGTFMSGYWMNANGQPELIINSKDALKIITEDHIPMSSMLSSNNNTIVLFGNETVLDIDLSYEPTGPRIGYAKIGSAIIPYILVDSGKGINLGTSTITDDLLSVVDPGYFYYAGTAPCKPVLMFTMTPQISSSGYIISPKNNIGISEGRQYNTIVIESTTKQEFQFTTPSIYTGYNQALYILSNTEVGTSWEDVRRLLRDNVKHYAPRAFATEVIDTIKNDSTITTAEMLSQAIELMKTFLYDENNEIAPITFTIDSKTGKCNFMLSYHKDLNNAVTVLEQNAGDMVRSNYLIIKDRNYFTDNGYVTYWTNEHPQYSYRIYADIAGGVTNLNLHYSYMYL